MRVLIPLLVFTLSSLAQPQNEWVEYYSPPAGSGRLYDIYYTADNHLAAGGQATIPQAGAMWLLVTNIEGEVVMNMNIPIDFDWGIEWKCNTLIECDNGDLLIGGYAGNIGRGPSRRFAVIRVSREGEVVWNQIWDGDFSSDCRALIELKEGDYLGCGQIFNGRSCGYLIRFDAEGNTVWERIYDPNADFGYFTSMREADNTVVIAGARRILAISPGEGDVIWQTSINDVFLFSIVSLRGDGFAACGGGVNATTVIRISPDGEINWRSDFDQFPLDPVTWCNVSLADDSQTLCGANRIWVLYHTDANGNLSWTRVENLQGGSGSYRSIVRDEREFLYAAGYNNDLQGVIVKIRPERSAPRIVEWSPESLELQVVTSQEVEFWFRAVDVQGDSVSYQIWLDDQLIVRDSNAVIRFEQNGERIVTAIASDGALADSMAWLVHVRDLLIFSHTPDTLSLTLQRNSEIDFALDSVAYIGDLENLRYEWMIYDSTAVRWEEVGGDDRIGIRSYAFARTGGYALKARVFDPNVDPVPADSVQWAIQVRGVIRAYEPNLPELSLEPRQEATFELIPFNANNDSIEFWWTLNEADTLSTQSTLSISFADTGRYVVSGYARERVSEDEWEEDVQVWVVNVHSLSAGLDPRLRGDDEGGSGDDENGKGDDDPLLLTIVPNPFNDQAMVMIDLGGQAFLPALRADKNVRPPSAQVGGLIPVRLSLYAIDGREVLRLHDGPLSPGSHQFRFFTSFRMTSGGGMPSGVYFLSLQAGSKSRTVKAVLLR
ncbi:MAG: hypothetical protein FJY67_11565 [Calditrichaeota bacterium]|nr:hypothetical protein [Calditrichota bacterium]